jgi:hypothetical protein
MDRVKVIYEVCTGCLLIALMERVKVIHGVCTGCHLMVFTPS